MVFAQLARLSPSLKLVLKVLQSNGWMTQKEIIFETTLPPRTVRHALKKLKFENLVQEKSSLADMRIKSFAAQKPTKTAFFGDENGK